MVHSRSHYRVHVLGSNNDRFVVRQAGIRPIADQLAKRPSYSCRWPRLLIDGDDVGLTPFGCCSHTGSKLQPAPSPHFNTSRSSTRMPRVLTRSRSRPSKASFNESMQVAPLVRCLVLFTWAPRYGEWVIADDFILRERRAERASDQQGPHCRPL
jgi:hypothetical protein